MARLINVDKLVEKLEAMKEKNIDRPLGATMNMGLNQAIAVANAMLFFEVMEEDDEG